MSPKIGVTPTLFTTTQGDRQASVIVFHKGRRQGGVTWGADALVISNCCNTAEVITTQFTEQPCNVMNGKLQER